MNWLFFVQLNRMRGIVSYLLVMYLWLWSASAQESIGVAIDNHTPVNGMMLNPSAIADQKPWIDIHLIGFGVHADNNLIYFSKSKYQQIRDLSALSYNLDRERAWAQTNIDVLGPSASVALGKHGVGFHTAVRFSGNVKRLPNIIAQVYTGLDESSIPDEVSFVAKRTRAKTLAWGEVGLSYARILYQFDRHLITGGVTLNRLLGFQANSFILKRAEVHYDTVNGLDAENAVGKYSYAAPAFTAGGGWGGSIGITYKRMVDEISKYKPHAINYDCLTLPYRYKIMVALTDIGGIRVKRGGLYNKFDLEDDLSSYFSSIGGTGLTDIEDILKDGERYTVTTPAALTTQFDYNFGWGAFLNGLWVQRLTPPSFYGPERANLLAITPRYERKWLMVMMPISLINYRSPHLGFAFRLATLTIGTENVIPFLFKSDIYAADIYFHLRIRFYKGLGCRKREYSGAEGFRFLDKFRRTENSPDACPKW